MSRKQTGRKKYEEMRLPSDAEAEGLLDYSNRSPVQPSERAGSVGEPSSKPVKILEKSIKKINGNIKEFAPLTKILSDNGSKLMASFTTSGTVIDSQDENTRKQNHQVRTYFTAKAKMFPGFVKNTFKHKDAKNSSDEGLLRGSQDRQTSMMSEIQNKMKSNFGMLNNNFQSMRKGSQEWFTDHTATKKKTGRRKPKRNPNIPEDFEYDLTLYNSPYSEGIEDIDGEIRLVPHPCYDPERVNLYKKKNTVKQEVPAEARMTFRPALVQSPKTESPRVNFEVDDSDSDAYDSEEEFDDAEMSPLARQGGKFSEASILVPDDFNVPPPLPKRDGVTTPVLQSRAPVTSQGKSA